MIQRSSRPPARVRISLKPLINLGLPGARFRLSHPLSESPIFRGFSADAGCEIPSRLIAYRVLKWQRKWQTI
jgi:hypothetical protein